MYSLWQSHFIFNKPETSPPQYLLPLLQNLVLKHHCRSEGKRRKIREIGKHINFKGIKEDFGTAEFLQIKWIGNLALV
jgi:hypothetical protein